MLSVSRMIVYIVRHPATEEYPHEIINVFSTKRGAADYAKKLCEAYDFDSETVQIIKKTVDREYYI